MWGHLRYHTLLTKFTLLLKRLIRALDLLFARLYCPRVLHKNLNQINNCWAITSLSLSPTFGCYPPLPKPKPFCRWFPQKHPRFDGQSSFLVLAVLVVTGPARRAQGHSGHRLSCHQAHTEQHSHIPTLYCTQGSWYCWRKPCGVPTGGTEAFPPLKKLE